jgi:hypothetical protein
MAAKKSTGAPSPIRDRVGTRVFNALSPIADPKYQLFDTGFVLARKGSGWTVCPMGDKRGSMVQIVWSGYSSIQAFGLKVKIGLPLLGGVKPGKVKTGNGTAEIRPVWKGRGEQQTEVTYTPNSFKDIENIEGLDGAKVDAILSEGLKDLEKVILTVIMKYCDEDGAEEEDAPWGSGKSKKRKGKPRW